MAEARPGPAPLTPLPAGALAPPLLAWFYENKRDLPFRAQPTPYHIWVSEIMLQQTQVATMLPYYERFITALPDAAALAACDEQRLLKLWEGLGYYSRVRNLQKAARVVVAEHGGALPASYEALLALPGVGPYTAGAIASLAFGLPCVAVDGNVLRVLARLTACEADVGAPATHKQLAAEVRRQLPEAAPGPYNEALMELGALVCVPGAPRCGACPLAGLCRGLARGLAGRLPVKAPKAAKKEITINALVVRGPQGVLLCRRPQSGLLAGLWGPPTRECSESREGGGGPMTRAEAELWLEQLAPGAAITGALPAARHVFTHRVWRLGGWLCAAPADAVAPAGCVYAAPAALHGQYAVPGAFAAWLPLMAGEDAGTNGIP